MPPYGIFFLIISCIYGLQDRKTPAYSMIDEAIL